MGCTQQKQQKQQQQQDPLPLINLLIVGLTGSGKSTILNQLKGQPQATCPQQLGIDSFIINNKIKIIVFQVAGRASNSWYHYYNTSNIVILVVDVSMDSQCYRKIQDVLLEMDQQITTNAKIIVVFNKVDLLMNNSNNNNDIKQKLNQETSHMTQYLDNHSNKVKQMSKLNFQHLKHQVFTCKCSAKDKIGVNNLMRKIYALAHYQIYGDQQQEQQNKDNKEEQNTK